MLYSGTLAAFQIWGDCSLARRYLRLACSINPRVLLKVLGRARIPGTLSVSIY